MGEKKDQQGPAAVVPSRLPDRAEAEAAVRTLLAWIGEDPDREGLIRTPARVAESLARLTDGAAEEPPEELIRDGVFEEKNAGLVLVRDIEFYSLCEHHLLPFFGRVHVAYLPDDRIIGLSKIPRLVDHFARRLQVQERLTNDIAEVLERVVKPRGVACIVEALHLCMAMRGVEKQRAVAVTTAYRGVYADDGIRRRELGGLLDVAGGLKA